MTDSPESMSTRRIGRRDASQQNVISVSKMGNSATDVDQAQSNFRRNILIDREVCNLINWLAEQQGISPEVALKKAVATAAYIYDVTTSQGGKLLVQRPDKSVGEIVLK